MSDWPHSPPHRTFEPGTYMITGATLHRRALFTTPEKLTMLNEVLLERLAIDGFILQAWAVFPNHYHVVLSSPNCADCLPITIKKIHEETARKLNHYDNCKSRRVWFQFWDKHLTYRESWLPRLKYVHNNASHHGLVTNSTEYPWCSAAWFDQNGASGFKRLVNSFKTDRLKVFDDYTPHLDGWRWRVG